MQFQVLTEKDFEKMIELREALEKGKRIYYKQRFPNQRGIKKPRKKRGEKLKCKDCNISIGSIRSYEIHNFFGHEVN